MIGNIIYIDFQKLETAIDGRMNLAENHDLLDYILFPTLNEVAQNLRDDFPFDDYVFDKKMDVGEVVFPTNAILERSMTTSLIVEFISLTNWRMPKIIWILSLTNNICIDIIFQFSPHSVIG